jgi:uncharacterized protein YciI
MRKIFTCLQLATAGLVLCLAAPVLAQSPANTPAQTAAPAPAPTPKKMQFFLKLIPPRPTFAQDMTADEMAIMQKHAAYWVEVFKTGKVLIIGPVMDAKGAWGMAVLETDSLADAQQMADNDPSVKAGLNKVEVSPMQVFLRKQ